MWKQRKKSFICGHLMIFAAYVQNDEDFQHINTDVQKIMWQNSYKMLTPSNADHSIT